MDDSDSEVGGQTFGLGVRVKGRVGVRARSWVRRVTGLFLISSDNSNSETGGRTFGLGA